MKVLLSLCACFCLGLSDDELYGSRYKMRLSRKTELIEFSPSYSTNVKILWRRDDPPATEDSKRKVMGIYYVINNLTQEDSGRYTMRDSDRISLFVKHLTVVAHERSYDRSAGESFSFAFDLEPNSCNVFFLPESDSAQGETVIVRKGRLRQNWVCSGFELRQPCGVFNDNLQRSCRGRYEIRDSADNTALMVTLNVEVQPWDSSKIGMGFGISFAILSCCSCLTKCCCGKSKKDKSETSEAEAEAAAQYDEYDHEPVALRPEQQDPTSGMQYPAQPAHTPTEPLIHRPPTEVPPAYSEVFPAPTFPLQSDAEPRFELKGMNFPSALSADSSHSGVYTSDKLNFL